MNSDPLRLRSLAFAFLVMGLLLLAPVFCHAGPVRIEVVTCQNEGEAWQKAYLVQRHTAALSPAFNVPQVFRHGTTSSMFPVFCHTNYICTIEGVPFEQVQADDVVVAKANRNAREIVEWGTAGGYIMHPCTGRTPELLFTCGMESIANRNPPADHPVDREHYVGVVRQTFHW